MKKIKRLSYIFVVALIYILSTTDLLNTETLTLTTYYPAPYGGYVNLLTTNNTYLARDGGSVGIGTMDTTGVKLAVNGKVKIADGSQGDGKVLTSDANGVATWQLPGGVPRGTILMWYGGTWNFDSTGRGIGPLQGWALCNGQNGTPNLSNRFIRATTTSAGLGVTGGADTYSLTVDQLPPHTHTIRTDGNHNHYLYRMFWSWRSYAGRAYKGAIYPRETQPFVTAPAGAHNHGGATGSTGIGAPIDNRPAYFQLAFIMKL